jgi:hypothetical protein
MGPFTIVLDTLALDGRILDRLARFDELQPHAIVIGPLVEHPAAQSRTIIRLNHRRQSTLLQHCLRLLRFCREPNYRVPREITTTEVMARIAYSCGSCLDWKCDGDKLASSR